MGEWYSRFFNGVRIGVVVLLATLLHAEGSGGGEGESGSIQRLSLIQIYITPVSCTLFAVQDGFGRGPNIPFRRPA